MDYYITDNTKYDMILCSHVMSHVLSNRDNFVDAMISMLNKDGILIVCNHIDQDWFTKLLWNTLPNLKIFNNLLLSRLYIDMYIMTYDSDTINKINGILDNMGNRVITV